MPERRSGFEEDGSYEPRGRSFRDPASPSRVRGGRERGPVIPPPAAVPVVLAFHDALGDDPVNAIHALPAAPRAVALDVPPSVAPAGVARQG